MLQDREKELLAQLVGLIATSANGTTALNALAAAVGADGPAAQHPLQQGVGTTAGDRSTHTQAMAHAPMHHGAPAGQLLGAKRARERPLQPPPTRPAMFQDAAVDLQPASWATKKHRSMPRTVHPQCPSPEDEAAAALAQMRRDPTPERAVDARAPTQAGLERSDMQARSSNLAQLQQMPAQRMPAQRPIPPMAAAVHQMPAHRPTPPMAAAIHRSPAYDAARAAVASAAAAGNSADSVLHYAELLVQAMDRINANVSPEQQAPNGL
jgi:hypothetical protein